MITPHDMTGEQGAQTASASSCVRLTPGHPIPAHILADPKRYSPPPADADAFNDYWEALIGHAQSRANAPREKSPRQPHHPEPPSLRRLWNGARWVWSEFRILFGGAWPERLYASRITRAQHRDMCAMLRGMEHLVRALILIMAVRLLNTLPPLRLSRPRLSKRNPKPRAENPAGASTWSVSLSMTHKLSASGEAEGDGETACRAEAERRLAGAAATSSSTPARTSRNPNANTPAHEDAGERDAAPVCSHGVARRQEALRRAIRDRKAIAPRIARRLQRQLAAAAAQQERQSALAILAARLIPPSPDNPPRRACERMAIPRWESAREILFNEFQKRVTTLLPSTPDTS